MILAIFYIFAILCIIFYYTGHLKRWKCEWILIVLAVAVFPTVLFADKVEDSLFPPEKTAIIHKK
jgi:Ca2+/Na+ antiporter